MAKKIVKLWYDPEGDYLEVIFEQKTQGVESFVVC